MQRRDLLRVRIGRAGTSCIGSPAPVSRCSKDALSIVSRNKISKRVSHPVPGGIRIVDARGGSGKFPSRLAVAALFIQPDRKRSRLSTLGFLFHPRFSHLPFKFSRRAISEPQRLGCPPFRLIPAYQVSVYSGAFEEVLRWIETTSYFQLARDSRPGFPGQIEFDRRDTLDST